jgi:short subunit dehydrogenase-like uncharacterized protein
MELKSSVPVLVADTSDSPSLQAAFSQARIVLNCTGEQLCFYTSLSLLNDDDTEDNTDFEFLFLMMILMVTPLLGPYRFLGEAVVRACLAAGSHYMDISGEPQFMEDMFLK